METAGWVPEPNCGRGTLSVVWACLPTIMFVLWTAIHLDANRSMGRAMWGLFVFFVPEAMPASAIDQLIKARRLQNRLRALIGWESWTLKQSFLVVKRGVRGVGGGETLTPRRLVELAEQQQYVENEQLVAHGSKGIRLDLLPSGDAIDRRSKKTWFEKILAGLQALWFCANIVSRLASGYVVTPLEDMTIAYTCCGLIASVAWLRCPQDIEDPFEVDLDAADDAMFAAVECGYSNGRDSDSHSSSGSSCPVSGSDGLMMGIVCILLCLRGHSHSRVGLCFPLRSGGLDLARLLDRYAAHRSAYSFLRRQVSIHALVYVLDGPGICPGAACLVDGGGHVISTDASFGL